MKRVQRRDMYTFELKQEFGEKIPPKKHTHTHTLSRSIPTHRCCDRLTFAGSKYQRLPWSLVTLPEFTVYIWKADRSGESERTDGEEKKKERSCNFFIIFRKPMVTSSNVI